MSDAIRDLRGTIPNWREIAGQAVGLYRDLLNSTDRQRQVKRACA